MAASFLEASGAFSILGAQVIYLIQPMIGDFLPDSALSRMAEMLDNPSQKRDFISVLREEVPH